MAELTPAQKEEIHLKCVKRTTELVWESVKSGGGPFSSLIVDDYGNIIGEGCNQIPQTCDPTAHAEMEVIRETSRKLKMKHFPEYTIYASGYPCSMCMSAIYLAQFKKVIFLTPIDTYKASCTAGPFATIDTIAAELVKDFKDQKLPIVYHQAEEAWGVHEYYQQSKSTKNN